MSETLLILHHSFILQTTLIDICLQNNASEALKENLNNFRNTCQHTSMSLLESVISHLIKKINAIVRNIEQTEGVEKITKILNDRESGPETADNTAQANVA